MTKPDSASDVISQLRETLSGLDEVEFAVLFGCFDDDQACAASDLDVAIKFRDDLDRHERFRERCRLSGELQGSDRPFVDVSDLDELPIAVARDAVHGRLLCGDDARFRNTRDEVDAVFGERRGSIRQRQRDVIARIAEDGLHG